MMEKYKVLGIMSGTSLDGLDLAYCHFTKTGPRYFFSVEKAITISYPDAWQERLSKLVSASALEITQANTDLGSFIGKEVKKFISDNQLEPEFIASHGHTIFHQPHKGFSLQIGSGHQIMVESGIKVVNDFRSLDVALGGQGAPLVPIGDELLFYDYDFCLNLGGIANVSARDNGKRIAYDVCPANMILNHLSQRMGLDYDAGGKMAAGGTLLPDLLVKLDQLDFYAQAAPKSLGYEWVSAKVFPLLEESTYSTPDLLHTFCFHIARQISFSLSTYAQKEQKTILVTGGGAYNTFFIQLLERHLHPLNIKVIVPEKLIVEYKEALIFAFLGVLRIRNEINCLSSVTGASRDSCCGQIFEPIS